ncbi:5833_t:CDS:2 [Cetraspora pellucida]|uniref:5833_t:CDS:1 n=1 Tax=Cetraspora pellucida TaxID=1433469 RepID=A0A9N8VCL5_9GLOM|nr:5833_t:CDS:2 [Cetraspora pellucida]
MRSKQDFVNIRHQKHNKTENPNQIVDNESLSNDNNKNNNEIFITEDNEIFVPEDSEIFTTENNNKNINGLNSIKIIGILKKEIQVEPHVIDIINIFKGYKVNSNDKLSESNIMNLSPNSEFVKQIPLEIYERFIGLFENYNKLILDETRNFLVDFFLSGKITSPNYVNRQKGDGIEFATNSSKYQIVYVEGTRPYKVDDKKVIENQNKIGKNLKNLYSEIIKERMTTRKVIMPDMEVFGVSSVRCNIHMYVFRFFGEYYLREVDNASVSRDYTEMEEFIYFYEVILKWAIIINRCLKKLSDKSLKKRSSRLSYALNVRNLDDLP